MVGVPLGIRSVVRNRADSPPILLENRFFEKNPINQVEQVSLIERPALVEYLDVGPGPGRRLFTQKGFSTDDLFHVSGDELWKHHMEDTRLVTSTQISGFVDGQGSPDIAATDTYLWITDGYEMQYTDGTSALTPITTPDFKPMISLDVFNGYVMCVQNDSDRFYWIEPGDIVIDPLNFATAERTPDRILQVRTVGDTFWLLGEKTTEVWRATGVADAPFMRIEGRLFDRGISGGTAVRVKDSVIVVGDDGMVYDITGGPKPISDPSIAERTRNAIRNYEEQGI
jgi:hypothetical protein